MQTGQSLVSQHIQVVRFGLISKKHPVALHRAGFLPEGSRRVLQLCLQLEDVLAHLRQNRALERSLALSHSLAARGLETSLAERVQHELDILHRAADRVVDHLQGVLIGTGGLALVLILIVGASAHTTVRDETLLLLGRVDLLFQVVALEQGAKEFSERS